MKLHTIGILGGADIAYKSFLPALNEIKSIKCLGLASNNIERRKKFANEFNIEVFENYADIIQNPLIDIVYLPLPPKLHFEWGKVVLENGKHLFLEKPSTTNYKDSKTLADLAEKKNLVIQENYMFQYHSQLKVIQKLINDGEIGDLRLIRGNFSFPMRSKDDFRYNKELGGGALMDAGGYLIKIASILLKHNLLLKNAEKIIIPNFDIDMCGAVTLTNDEGLIFQGFFGMDNYYQCSLEIYGNRGRIYTNRIFTAPAAYKPVVYIENTNGNTSLEIDIDNQFINSIQTFLQAISDDTLKKQLRDELLLQSRIVDEVKMQWLK